MKTTATTLAHWQQLFTDSLLGKLQNELQTELENSFQPTSSEAKAKRFAIYKNNVFYSLTNALADLYPVIKKLVGEDFFAGTANFYLREHPPQQAAMVHFGQGFPDFLRAFTHTKDMPYLAPVAELELARHRAYHAVDTQPIDLASIAAISPEQLADATVNLHPSLQILQASQPIFTIWQTNQEVGNESAESSKNIQLNEPEQVLVVRPLYEVCVYNIDQGMYQFISHLQLGHTVQEAIEITQATHSEFDAGQVISFAIQAQLLTAIHTHS